MNNLKRYFYPAFFVVVFLQIAAVSWQIVNYERILHFGDILNLKVEPKDPYDAFRGRYISLRFAQNSLNVTDKDFGEINPKTFFITFDDNSTESFPDDVFLSAPDMPKPYLKADGYISKEYDSDERKLYIDYPFERFYMQEEFARNVDSYGWRFFSEHNATARVRVLGGKGVIENVFIDGTPITEYIKRVEKEK